MKKLGLTTEGFGHGFFCLLYAKAMGLTPVAFSEKDNEADFTAQVEQIYNNLAFFAPNMVKATWEEREQLLAEGLNIREKILQDAVTDDEWLKIAQTTLTPNPEEVPGLPKYSLSGKNILFVPQKLISDGRCGSTAEEQSVGYDYFKPLKKEGVTFILGQHFDKINDLPKIEEIKKEFNAYVPGDTENPEVFGIRKIPHKMYWNLYEQIDSCIGIAGTHTWYALACFPHISLGILHPTKNENWKRISAAYQAVGRKVYELDINKSANLEKDIMELYKKL